jgi:hypothetical protein
VTSSEKPRRVLPRALVVAVVVAGILLLGIVLMDFFGSQPQPFQYMLH